MKVRACIRLSRVAVDNVDDEKVSSEVKLKEIKLYLNYNLTLRLVQ